MYGPDAISDLIARNPNSGCSKSNDNEERIPSGDDSPLHTIRITWNCSLKLECGFDWNYKVCEVHVDSLWFFQIHILEKRVF